MIDKKRKSLKNLRANTVSFQKDTFINDVCNDRYVLVVGSEVMLDKDMFADEKGDMMQYILDTLNQLLDREEHPYTNLNDLVSSRPPISSDIDLSGADLIRYAIKPEYDENEGRMVDFMDIDDMAPELVDLIRKRLFRLVMTTTFDDCLERLMRSIWGKELRVVNIADSLDWQKFQKEIKDTIDLSNPMETVYKYNRPTLIYIFGKALQEDKSKNFVKTENDAIEFIERWMKSEDHIINMIKKRRILALGCKFDDWYFRFFWYILKRDFGNLGDGEVALSLNDGNESDDSLRGFLNRKNIFYHPDARQFMCDICNMLTPESHTPESQAFHDILLSRRGNGEIFLSYCSRDFALASKLFFQLTEMGYSVWFDHESLCGGNYNSDITKAINNASVVITLLTDEVARDLSDGDASHYYNEEWRLAAQTGCDRLIPLAANGYSLRASYHTKNDKDERPTYENIIKGQVDGVDLMADGIEKLVKTIENVKSRNRK